MSITTRRSRPRIRCGAIGSTHEWRAETRPGERERLWKAIHAETFGANPAALPAFIAKSEGRRSVHDLFTAESDPETAALYWRLSHPWVYGPEGGQSA